MPSLLRTSVDSNNMDQIFCTVNFVICAGNILIHKCKVFDLIFDFVEIGGKLFDLVLEFGFIKN